MKFYYVYVLSSEKDGSFYVGFTFNLVNRLNKHNKGQVQSTLSKKALEIDFL